MFIYLFIYLVSQLFIYLFIYLYYHYHYYYHYYYYYYYYNIYTYNYIYIYIYIYRRDVRVEARGQQHAGVARAHRAVRQDVGRRGCVLDVLYYMILHDITMYYMILCYTSLTSTAWTPTGTSSSPLTMPWLRTNGVNTNGAAEEVIIFDGFGKKVRPGTFGNIKVD